jgi:PAS domain S-box-containing protein
MTTILIADDNTQNLYLLESILKGNKFEVVAVRNGADALDAAQKNPPDLVIADILMPVMDGFELCRRWMADDRLNRIPFVFYTATYTDPKDERFAMSLGAERFLIKPMKPELLMQAVHEVLEEAQVKKTVPPVKPLRNEREVLRQYNEVLFRKLEKKVVDLEGEISERKQAEEKLLQSEMRYRKLYENMRDAFIRVNMAGQLLEYNPAFKEMIGYSDKELIGMTSQDLTPEKWQAFDTYIVETQILPRGYSDVYEKEYRKKDGVVFPVELRTILVRDESGQPRGMWAIVRDITDRKSAEEKIRLANRKLALMDDVTYQDIHNKVTGLRGYVELSKKSESEHDRQAFIEREMGILASIHDLINHTKEYQQMGMDKSRWISLEDTILGQFSIISREHAITLECKVDGLEINTDPLIERVFYNLIHNAIQHSKTLTRISFGYQETSDGLVLTCEDNGVGIPAGQKTKIFDRVVGGGGKFGLFFVREFLTLSGMTISETGTPGTGARFEITVPNGLYRFSRG